MYWNGLSFFSDGDLQVQPLLKGIYLSSLSAAYLGNELREFRY